VTTVAPPEVLDRGAEDELVLGILRRAELEDVAGGAPEMYDRPSTAAFRSLAVSRGVALDVVVRHAVRGTLSEVVRMPATTDPSAPATAGPTTSEGEPDV